jgi:hypothetical protein
MLNAPPNMRMKLSGCGGPHLQGQGCLACGRAPRSLCAER